MKTSEKIRYKVKVKLTSIITEATSTGFSITKLRGTEIIYIDLDPDFLVNSETMEDFCELVREEVSRQTLYWGDRDYKMWIQSYDPLD